MERLKEKWWSSNPKAIKCETQDDQSDGISIQNIGGVFIVIFVGIGLACITLAFEYWWYKYRKGSKIISVQEVNKEFAPSDGRAADKLDKNLQKRFNRSDAKDSKLIRGVDYPRSRF